MATVFKAHEPGLDRHVALKVLPPVAVLTKPVSEPDDALAAASRADPEASRLDRR